MVDEQKKKIENETVKSSYFYGLQKINCLSWNTFQKSAFLSFFYVGNLMKMSFPLHRIGDFSHEILSFLKAHILSLKAFFAGFSFNVKLVI
jgi:hypothetical protein